MSLNNLSVMLSQLSQHEAAREAMRESVDIRRRFTPMAQPASGASVGAYTSKRVPKGSSALSFQLVSYASGGAGPVTAPGTFTLMGGHPGADAFGAEWSFVDASCADTTVSATGGTVTVTTASGSQLTGTFDLTFGSDHSRASSGHRTAPPPIHKAIRPVRERARGFRRE
jgi:hypothetical protein